MGRLVNYGKRGMQCVVRGGIVRDKIYSKAALMGSRASALVGASRERIWRGTYGYSAGDKAAEERLPERLPGELPDCQRRREEAAERRSLKSQLLPMPALMKQERFL